MKKLISNYVFNPTAKTIVFSDYDAIVLSQILLITNTTTNEIIYNFASLGWNVSWNTLNLMYDTTGMSSLDSLQIFYEDVDINPATEMSQTNQEIMTAQLVSLLLTTLWNIAGAGNNRLSIDVGTLYNTLPWQATLGTVTTIGTLNNQLTQGNVSSFLTAQYLSDQYTLSYLNNITIE